MTNTLTLPKAHRIVKAYDAELAALNEDWFSGRIPTASDYNRHCEALKVAFPEYQAAVSKLHVAKAAARQAASARPKPGSAYRTPPVRHP